MTQSQKVNVLLARKADDIRRHALDELDQSARDTNTWGSPKHREGRDRVEKVHDDARRALEKLPEEQLDKLLAEPAG